MLTKWLYHSALLCALTLFLLPAAAQESTAPAPLSLQDCITLAQKNQADILAGQYSLTATEARAVQAKSSYYPQVSLSNTAFTMNSGASMNRSNGTSISITQNFFDGGLRAATLRAAKANITQSTSGLARTKQSVVFDVTRDYFDYLRAQQLADVNAAKTKYLEGQLALVQERVRVGDAAEVDSLPVESSLANARVDQLSAKNSVRTAAILLQQAMGLTPQADFAVQDYTLAAPVMVKPLDAYVKAAMVSRPDVSEVKANVMSVKASLDTAKIQQRPRPVISGDYSQPVFSGDKSGFSVSGGIVFDIFNGGSTKAAVHEAQANLSTAELRAKQLAKDIEADVQNAYLNLNSAQERLTASDISVKVAQRNLDTQDERYKQGLAITLDLINAQVEVVTAQSNAVQARYDYYTALAQLEYATGTQGELYAN